MSAKRENPASLEVSNARLKKLVKLCCADGDTPSSILGGLIDAAYARRNETRTVVAAYKAKLEPSASKRAPKKTASPETELAEPIGAPSGFEADFEAAFIRLDSGANQVLLRDLREALPEYRRAEFDAGVNTLRRLRKITLDTSDGRHTRLPDSAREGGIVEGSNVYVYAARR